MIRIILIAVFISFGPTLGWGYLAGRDALLSFAGNSRRGAALRVGGDGPKPYDASIGKGDDARDIDPRDQAGARAQLSALWSSSAPGALPALDAGLGAVGAGQCLVSALHAGCQRLTVDVDVPFLDRDHPHLYSDERAAYFALELAKRVASHAKSALDHQHHQEEFPAVGTSESMPPAFPHHHRLTFVVFSTEMSAAAARASWGGAAACARLGVVPIGLALDDGRSLSTGGRSRGRMDMEDIMKTAGRLESSVASAITAHSLLKRRVNEHTPVDKLRGVNRRQERERCQEEDGGKVSGVVGQTALSSPPPLQVAGFVMVAPANRMEVVATRKAIAIAIAAAASSGGPSSSGARRQDHEEAASEVDGGGGSSGVGGDTDTGSSCGAVVVLFNPRFGKPKPRELDSFKCAFGLSPFRVKALGNSNSRLDKSGGSGIGASSDTNKNNAGDNNNTLAFRPSVVVLKRWGSAWELFVDADGSGHAFCGSFGDSSSRPAASVFLPAVVNHLRHAQHHHRHQLNALQQQKQQQQQQQQQPPTPTPPATSPPRPSAPSDVSATVAYLNQLLELSASPKLPLNSNRKADRKGSDGGGDSNDSDDNFGGSDPRAGHGKALRQQQRRQQEESLLATSDSAENILSRLFDRPMEPPPPPQLPGSG